MPSIHSYRESKFLKKDDITRDTLVTIKRVENENAGTEEAPENKPCLYFQELDKGMILNWTNLQAAADACGSEMTEDWPGKQVVLYVDPNVSYQGKRTGGLRIRTPRRQAAQTAPQPADLPPVPPVEAYNDDIPF